MNPFFIQDKGALRIQDKDAVKKSAFNIDTAVTMVSKPAYD